MSIACLISVHKEISLSLDLGANKLRFRLCPQLVHVKKLSNICPQSKIMFSNHQHVSPDGGFSGSKVSPQFVQGGRMRFSQNGWTRPVQTLDFEVQPLSRFCENLQRLDRLWTRPGYRLDIPCIFLLLDRGLT